MNIWEEFKEGVEDGLEVTSNCMGFMLVWMGFIGILFALALAACKFMG